MYILRDQVAEGPPVEHVILEWISLTRLRKIHQFQICVVNTIMAFWVVPPTDERWITCTDTLHPIDKKHNIPWDNSVYSLIAKLQTYKQVIPRIVFKKSSVKCHPCNLSKLTGELELGAQSADWNMQFSSLVNQTEGLMCCQKAYLPFWIDTSNLSRFFSTKVHKWYQHRSVSPAPHSQIEVELYLNPAAFWPFYTRRKRTRKQKVSPIFASTFCELKMW